MHRGREPRYRGFLVTVPTLLPGHWDPWPTLQDLPPSWARHSRWPPAPHPCQWGPDLGRLLHDSVPTCRPSKTPDTPFLHLHCSLLPEATPWTSGKPAVVPSAFPGHLSTLQVARVPGHSPPPLPTGTILSSRMPAAPHIPATGNPHLRRPPGRCQVTILFTVKQLHSWPAVRRWVSVLRSSCCGCQQPCVWGTVHDDLWEGGGEKEGCVLLP